MTDLVKQLKEIKQRNIERKNKREEELKLEPESIPLKEFSERDKGYRFYAKLHPFEISYYGDLILEVCAAVGDSRCIKPLFIMPTDDALKLADFINETFGAYREKPVGEKQ